MWQQGKANTPSSGNGVFVQTGHGAAASYTKGEVGIAQGNYVNSTYTHGSNPVLALPIAKVSRRNQGAYNPVWNPNGSGCGYLGGTNSTADCFIHNVRVSGVTAIVRTCCNDTQYNWVDDGLTPYLGIGSDTARRPTKVVGYNAAGVEVFDTAADNRNIENTFFSGPTGMHLIIDTQDSAFSADVGSLVMHYSSTLSTQAYSYGDVAGATGGARQQSGRPDGRMYNEINQRDILDLRMSAHKIQDYYRTLEKAVTGATGNYTRGFEPHKMFTEIFAGGTNPFWRNSSVLSPNDTTIARTFQIYCEGHPSSTYSTNINTSNYQLGDVVTLMFSGGEWMTGVINAYQSTTQSLGIVPWYESSGFYAITGTGSYSSIPTGQRAFLYGGAEGTVSGKWLQQCDIFGSPNNYPSGLLEDGLTATPVLTNHKGESQIPADIYASDNMNFTLSRKPHGGGNGGGSGGSLDKVLVKRSDGNWKLFTYTGGGGDHDASGHNFAPGSSAHYYNRVGVNVNSSWSDLGYSSAQNMIDNTVVMIFYITTSTPMVSNSGGSPEHPKTLAKSKYVVGGGGWWPYHGGALGYWLTKKVPDAASSSGNIFNYRGITEWGIHNTSQSEIGRYAPYNGHGWGGLIKHDYLVFNTGGSIAWKCAPVLATLNGKAYVSMFYKEMKSASAVWGDDGVVNITSLYAKSELDDNNVLVTYGQRRFEIPYFISEDD